MLPNFGLCSISQPPRLAISRPSHSGHVIWPCGFRSDTDLLECYRLRSVDNSWNEHALLSPAATRGIDWYFLWVETWEIQKSRAELHPKVQVGVAERRPIQTEDCWCDTRLHKNRVMHVPTWSVMPRPKGIYLRQKHYFWRDTLFLMLLLYAKTSALLKLSLLYFWEHTVLFCLSII